jgi:hypothetical protein
MLLNNIKEISKWMIKEGQSIVIVITQSELNVLNQVLTMKIICVNKLNIF